MKISIVIPVLNEAVKIGPLVSYLFKNGGDRVGEIWVIDAGSTDATVLLASQAGAQVLHSTVKSRAAQMNIGARAAQFPILYFVHADTLPPRSFATDIQDALSTGIQMGCYRYVFDSSSFILKINAFFTRFNWLWCQGGDKTFFIEYHIFEALGGYDERYCVMEEYDFLRRASKHYRFQILPKNAIVSARKYQKNSWLRVQLANLIVFRKFRRGIEPAQIKATYLRLLKH
jgi:rSAM/selenodomain-associated transferase 2